MAVEESAQSRSSHAGPPRQLFGVDSQALGLAIDLVAVLVG